MSTENSGPRRIAIDSNGILWITQYNAGKIASLDPTTNSIKEYDTSSESSEFCHCSLFAKGCL
jgi:streptogramin lyase